MDGEPDGTVSAAGIALLPGEFTERLVAVDADRTAPCPATAGLVLLDTDVTPELAAEGTARDVVRVVQQARREAGLDVSDRIALDPRRRRPTVLDAVRAHEAFVAGEVLAHCRRVRRRLPAATSPRRGDGTRRCRGPRSPCWFRAR